MTREYSPIEFAMRVALMDNPTPDELLTRFDISRATAYRYVQTWRDVKGLPPLGLCGKGRRCDCGALLYVDHAYVLRSA